MSSHDVVLDTNAWLDMFHFDDAGARPLHEAARRGELRLIVDAATLDEFRRVISYPPLRIDSVTRALLLAKVGEIAHQVAPHTGAACTPALPRCRDADDQKFIELAARTGAGWLLTRDDELLRMARRLKRVLGLRVCVPAHWTPSAR